MTRIASKTTHKTDRKSRIVCPACDREASIDQECSVVRHDGRADIECPECGTVIVSQPQFESDDRRTPIPA